MRFSLCFNKQYWVVVYAAIYLMIQIVASFDLSYAVFVSARVMGNEQDDIIGLYGEVPLL